MESKVYLLSEGSQPPEFFYPVKIYIIIKAYLEGIDDL
jgi:hypothetical protein